MTIEEALSRPSISVPDAGRLFFGLSRCSSYEAARKGDIPVVKAGGRIVVPVAEIAAKFGLKTKFDRAA